MCSLLKTRPLRNSRFVRVPEGETHGIFDSDVEKLKTLAMKRAQIFKWQHRLDWQIVMLQMIRATMTFLPQHWRVVHLCMIQEG